jgi:prevent-host-death family protein
VINQSLTHGPQMITRHGKPVAVLLDADTYDRLSGHKDDSSKSFIEFLRSCPVDLSELDLTRSSEGGRDMTGWFDDEKDPTEESS